MNHWVCNHRRLKMTLNDFSFISVFTVYGVYDHIWILWTIDQLSSAISSFLSGPSLSLSVSSVTLSCLALSLVSLSSARERHSPPTPHTI